MLPTGEKSVNTDQRTLTIGGSINIQSNELWIVKVMNGTKISQWYAVVDPNRYKKPENVFFPSRESLNLIILKVIKSFRVEGAGASSRSWRKQKWDYFNALWKVNSPLSHTHTHKGWVLLTADFWKFWWINLWMMVAYANFYWNTEYQDHDIVKTLWLFF